jgi:hypothetical protein
MLYELTTPRDACCIFTKNHAMEVLRSDGFLNRTDKCILYILKGDTVFNGVTWILEAVNKWARQKLVRMETLTVWTSLDGSVHLKFLKVEYGFLTPVLGDVDGGLQLPLPSNRACNIFILPF